MLHQVVLISTALDTLKNDVSQRSDAHRILESSLDGLVSQSTYTEDVHDLRSEIRSLSNDLRIANSAMERYINEESLMSKIRQSERMDVEERLRLLQTSSVANKAEVLSKLSEIERVQRQAQYDQASMDVKIESAALLQLDVRKLYSIKEEISTTIKDMKLDILKLKGFSSQKLGVPVEEGSSNREINLLSIQAFPFESSNTFPTRIEPISNEPISNDPLSNDPLSSNPLPVDSAVSKTNIQSFSTVTEPLDESKLISSLDVAPHLGDDALDRRTEGEPLFRTSIGSSMNGALTACSPDADTSDDDIIPADDIGSPTERQHSLEYLDTVEDNDLLRGQAKTGSACYGTEDSGVHVSTPLLLQSDDMKRIEDEEDSLGQSSTSEADQVETNYHPQVSPVYISGNYFEDELIPADDPAMDEYRQKSTSVISVESMGLPIPVEALPRETASCNHYQSLGLHNTATENDFDNDAQKLSIIESANDNSRDKHLNPQIAPTIGSNLIVDHLDEVLDFDDFSDDEIIPADHPAITTESLASCCYKTPNDESNTAGVDPDVRTEKVPNPPEPNVSPEMNSVREKKTPILLSSEIFLDSKEDRKEERPLSPLSRRSLTSSPVPDPSIVAKAFAPNGTNNQSLLPPLQTSSLSIKWAICIIFWLAS